MAKEERAICVKQPWTWFIGGRSMSLAVAWSKCEDGNLRFFVMENHPELFSSNALIKFVRAELERLDNAYQSISSDLKKLGGKFYLKEIDDGFEVEVDHEVSVTDKTAGFFEGNYDSYNITRSELNSFKEVRKNIQKYLIGDAA